MRVFHAVALMMAFTGPVYAQTPPVPRYGEVDKDKSPSDIASERRAEAAYKRSLGNIPDAAPVDPWGNVRSDGAPKPASKASAVKSLKPAAPGN